MATLLGELDLSAEAERRQAHELRVYSICTARSSCASGEMLCITIVSSLSGLLCASPNPVRAALHRNRSVTLDETDFDSLVVD